MKELIEIKNLKFSYEIKNLENNLSINNLNLTIKKGEFVAILGKNGSGKSTLAKHLNSLLLPLSGDIIVDGMNTKDQNQLWNIRKKVGMIFQNPDNQIVANTVEEDVAFGLENIGYPTEKIRDRVYEALKMVSMYDFRKKSPSMLSGGQKQRVAIAGVLAMRPDCIVLDEPTAMLDPSGRKEVISIIKDLNKNENITAVLITHYMEEAVQADRVVVMEKGIVLKTGTPREVFRDVEAIKKIGLDVPQVTELAYELRKIGIPIENDIMSLDEMVMNLCQLL